MHFFSFSQYKAYFFENLPFALVEVVALQEALAHERGHGLQGLAVVVGDILHVVVE